VLIPLVTVALSAWIDDEPIDSRLVFGGPLVLAGVYLGALRPSRTALHIQVDKRSSGCERGDAPLD
jgi:drug/metabolite transporter (DMT)-like permease